MMGDILYSALSQGNKEAFDYIFRQMYPKVKTFIFHLCKDEFEAENIAQDIFMKLWINHERIKDIEDFDAYVFTMARNAALKWLRNYQHRQGTPINDIQIDSSAPSEDTLLYYKELEKIIGEEIEKMPPQRRTIFKMSRIDGLSHKQIAEKLGIGVRTVETHINLALRDLRKAASIMRILIILSLID